MVAITYSDFGANTEGREVAKAFSDKVAGKTVLVTGVNVGGIGYTIAEALASQSPAHVIITGRNQSRLEESLKALKDEHPHVDFRILLMDLSDQKSVREAASTFLSWENVSSLDILINSAGVMCVQERTITPDGVELHFATNHVGHWLFSCLVMPKLIKAAQSSPRGATRIVNVSSGSATLSAMRWDDMNFDKKNKELPDEQKPSERLMTNWGYTNISEEAYFPLDGYNRSKVANVLFGIGANKRLHDKYGITTLAVNPGVSPAGLTRNFPPRTLKALEGMVEKGVVIYKTREAGASTPFVAALDPALGVDVGQTKDGVENWGAFLRDYQINDTAHPLAVSSSEAEKLWAHSESVVKQEFAW